MRKLSLLILAVLLALALWAILVFTGARQGWWHADPGPREDVASFFSTSAAALDATGQGAVALVLIEKGKVFGEHYVSAGAPVTRVTLFQLASLSKWATALGVLKLAEQGRLDLDAPVSRYLTRWQLPETEYDADGVTARRLLSHTAGLTDGLGYMGFEKGTPVQTLEASLTEAADPMSGADGRTRVGREPGTAWQYSGGGYALLELLIEEISGEPFADYMKRVVFDPLGMSHATFDLAAAEAAGLAPCFDVEGAPCAYRNFAAPSAASLHASAADLARFLEAQMEGAGDPALPPGLAADMRAPHASQFGLPIWGLGVMLYAEAPGGGFIIGHEGMNFPAIETTARIDPATGDGILVLATGNPGLAAALGGEWVYWHAGQVDVRQIDSMLPAIGLTLLAGWAVIIVLAVLVFRRMRRSKSPAAS
ncbi:beta-lactamase [Parvibaculum lavamentivorans DS-1]|uniref:Beta-lactamase n=1 Tax=Parvibaculum lavamentivorans (strain DS-1 / DSM 13023 / NCIMB 13966) TaxID=402881 RepID=A7HRQ3_PARL1|nr:serine hydrolase domain-containing protein [Parvibaculum lavamentivorans]ABS62586.1 beta-lactamase [Parvibaculum lavamentivorans DS-1]